MAEKNRYSDEELEEFRQIINEKLEVAQRDYDALKASLMNADNNSTDDTSPTYKVLEEGANTLSKEETTRLAQRQMKFIQSLQAALVRIENSQGASSRCTSCNPLHRGQTKQTLIL